MSKEERLALEFQAYGIDELQVVRRVGRILAGHSHYSCSPELALVTSALPENGMAETATSQHRT